LDYQRQHFLGGYGIAYDRANDYIAYDFTVWRLQPRPDYRR
tara:strand:- start:6050 stop:6172 length:123 start_codon:yes stop_codon:yes gene_type:complete